MKTDTILSFLRKEAYPAFSQDDFRTNNPRTVVWVDSVLGSLTNEDLDTVLEAFREDNQAPGRLVGEVEWFRSRKPREKAWHKNEPVSQLLRWYSDKKSKKVFYASGELKRRFPGQSFQVQKKILNAFLCGGKKDVEWAARYLRDNWISTFENVVLAKWHEVKMPLFAYIILRHFPDAIIFQEQEAIAETVGYAYVCARLGNMKGFVVDEGRLSPEDWFYVMAKLGREDALSRIDDQLKACINSLKPLDLLLFQNGSILSVRPLSRVVWSMKKLHYTEGIIRLIEMVEHADEFSLKEQEESRHYAQLFSLQCQTENLDESDESYAKAKADWTRQTDACFTFMSDIDDTPEDLPF